MNEPELVVLKERDLIKRPTKKVVCESTSTLPIALKSILRYARRYLYSSVLGSKENVQYVFVDLSLISSGNTQKSRIRNLFSRLMVSKANQVVLAPFNLGGHWALLAINAYEDTMFYLDSLRTTSKATTRYVTDIIYYKSGALRVDTMS
ncbi:uncharacterized protein E6C27_scaffold316G001270 [Cucumis melo var. makuwa]|uniref:Ubiquitin-like protease family profile domain-containing protein n=1 Tax=Cucumis melo var. makuwa TaxID=1194695 RepID=A0A5A7TR59_CUCMM|nr:uncharacterized protein E6C27_scaffold316G001270 [Cucumis melo var. makuwa]